MIAPDREHFLTVADAAREIGLNRQTVTRAIRDGRMPGQLFGNTYRISREQWNDFKAGTWQPRHQPRLPIDMVHRKASDVGEGSA